MAVPVSPETVALTPTARQRWMAQLLLLVSVALQLPNVLRHSSDPSVNHLDATWRHYWLIALLPLYALAVVGCLLPVRVELGETALTLRRPPRRRRVLPWRSIQAVLVDERGSRRRVVVFGDDPDGWRTVLPVPVSMFLAKDSEFEEKFRLIGRTWAERRGEDWVELPAPRPDWQTASTPRPPV